MGNATEVYNHFNETMDSRVIPRERWEIGFNATIVVILVLVALAGNLLVVFAITKTSKLREQVSNMFIINLSCTDMILANVVMATSFVTIAMDVKTVPRVWCDIVCAVNYICIIVSMLTLAFISLDRFVAILRPIHYSSIVKKHRILLAIGYSWAQGLAFAAAPSIMQWVHYDYWEGICAIDWHKDKVNVVIYVITACVLCFLVPGMVMIFSYTSIIREARKINELPVPAINEEASRATAKRAAKTIRSLLVVVAFFFICMTPFCVTKLLKALSEDVNAVPTYANLTAAYFQYIASCINPFIYAIFRPDFRNAYSSILRRFRAQRDLELSASSMTHQND